MKIHENEKLARAVSVVASLIWTLLTTSALADDCTAARSAMLDTGHRPLSTTTTSVDAQGKKSVTRTIQTVTNKYVQTADGKWFSMNIAIKDLDDLKTAKFVCKRAGSDVVGGEPTTVYEVHMDHDGSISDNKMWISAKNLVLKAEQNIEGRHYTTVYDFSNVSPPANATAMGGK